MSFLAAQPRKIENVPIEDSQELENDLSKREYLWLQENQVIVTINEVLKHLRSVCVKLHLGPKSDVRMRIPNIQPNTEKHNLIPKNVNDNIKASVTLLDDNVIQAEVSIKHNKVAGGVYRGIAQPEVQWKLQQLQDLGNHIARATSKMCDLKALLESLTENKSFDLDTGALILTDLKSLKEEINLARTSIILPRKRSLLELCYFPPTRKFSPPLPQDLLVSFYISSCRLVFASYLMVPKSVNPQGLTVFLAERPLPYLDDVLAHLNVCISMLQTLVGQMEGCKFY